MWTLPGILMLFSALVAGGSALHIREQASQATILAAAGHEVLVTVKHSGDYFCPAYCRVDHRHIVHDIRWQCTQGAGCDHFRVLHVVGRPGDSLSPELLSLLEPGDAPSIP